MKNLSLFIFFLLLFIIDKSAGDCLACWKMYGVKIITKSDDTLYGYVTWNYAWMDVMENKTNSEFPKCFIEYLIIRGRSKFDFYKKIYIVEYPYKDCFVARKSDVDTIKINNIKRISRKKSPHDGLCGACDVPTVNDSVVALLNRKPYAQHTFYESCFDVHFLSYNKSIGSDSLKSISVSNFWSRIEEWEKNGVIILKISFD